MTSKYRFSINDIARITKEEKKRLINAEIYSMKDLVVRGAVNVSEATDIPRNTCERICSSARISLEELGVLNRPFMESTFKEERISLGSTALDNLLGGRGVQTRAITEFFGESNSGKTQLCHTTSVMVQLDRHQGGLVGKTLYIDTESTFRPERISSIAQARGLHRNKAVKNVIVANPMSSSEQEHFVETAGSIIDQHANIKLLVIDSVTGLYRADYIGRANLPQRQQRLYQYMQMLRRISEVYGVAVVITNQVNQSPEGFMDPLPKPVGGNVMAHSSTYRVRLRQFGPHRIAGLTHSPYLPEKQVWFGISVEGVHDVPKPEPLR